MAVRSWWRLQEEDEDWEEDIEDDDDYDEDDDDDEDEDDLEDEKKDDAWRVMRAAEGSAVL